MTKNDDNLVQPEGVNAGSAQSTNEGDTPESDAITGGHPERAADQAEPRDDQIVDAPFTPRDPDAPSLQQSIEEGAR